MLSKVFMLLLRVAKLTGIKREGMVKMAKRNFCHYLRFYVILKFFI